MQSEWLHNNQSHTLIVFCNGWGMDSNPFAHLSAAEVDVLMLFDYRNFMLKEDYLELIDKYQVVHLVAWSMGVWVGQHLFQQYADTFSKTIAINGTLCPIHDEYGIPGKIFNDTLEGFDEIARNKFYKRMCRERSTLKTFLSRQPLRPINDQYEELSYLSQNVTCLSVEESIFKDIRVSDSDWVVPSANQLRYWGNRNILHIQGFHYPFLLWQSWDHLLGEW